MLAKVKICMGTHCTMMGNLNLQENLEDLQLEYPGKIEIEAVKCLKFCEDNKAPVVELNGKIITNASAEKIISEILEVVR
ncbi:NAD(P)H-dependent oxidoreductase subunit E [Tissierella praeacuta]|uniref:Thioredoxin-like [2Fe-2S] ferredoxin n=1 Tax=Tissierella praeacuta DSM 18095 TaxID=1123404 RepID=A0A1M4W8P7_9FIRM|nr:NAD(P)H-dependent oxidoreductase subunit E [Tissierella praeacuta]HAE91927.1 NAD(P)H-dependent oxidoreductase subunit E [Tissierella sp.]MBU5256097.1 NAD(P)H-dependent oxidoreductase subunit E [Tissierella praeacuta]TCU75556.1 thioredoxin-like protein [Tissierella praeacuta]SHE77596.1 Thioredoxin-like [2Fe-2S] ferredoxin [Tissierella praeacuta DSM 18095]SUO99966.1 NADH:ubiquinone oxidoreductase 24 kD subunit [Tissierella praeacuta]